MSDEEKQRADAPSGDADEGGAESEESGEQESASPAEPRRGSRRRSARTALEESEPSSDPAPKTEAAKPKQSLVFLAVTAVIDAALDLGTKEWAATRLKEPGAKIVVIENYMHFDLATNKGGAWGFLGDQPDSIRLPFFFAISAFAVWFIVRMYRQLEPGQNALKWALPIVLGGAIGNLVDRVRHQHVIDFIDCFIITDGQARHWPTYNVADIWIVAGVILMAIDGLTPKPAVRRVVRRVKVVEDDDKPEGGSKSEDAEKAQA